MAVSKLAPGTNVVNEFVAIDIMDSDPRPLAMNKGLPYSLKLGLGVHAARHQLFGF
jgi:hypothetical protein